MMTESWLLWQARSIPARSWTVLTMMPLEAGLVVMGQVFGSIVRRNTARGIFCYQSEGVFWRRLHGASFEHTRIVFDARSQVIDIHDADRGVLPVRRRLGKKLCIVFIQKGNQCCVRRKDIQLKSQCTVPGNQKRRISLWRLRKAVVSATWIPDPQCRAFADTALSARGSGPGS